MNELQDIFLRQAGPDGVRPNGSLVASIRREAKVRINPLFFQIDYGPLLLSLRLPPDSARKMHEMKDGLRSAKFEFAEKGIGATILREADKVSFAFLSCPFKYKPSDSPVDLLGREYRVIPETDADLFLFAIEASLRILHEARSR